MNPHIRAIRYGTPCKVDQRAAALTAALCLPARVESQVPIMTDTQPLLGQQFEVHLYETLAAEDPALGAVLTAK